MFRIEYKIKFFRKNRGGHRQQAQRIPAAASGPPISARAIFILGPISRKHGQYSSTWISATGSENSKRRKLKIVRQQIGIGMRQTFQYYNGGRSAKVDHPFPRVCQRPVRK